MTSTQHVFVLEYDQEIQRFKHVSSKNELFRRTSVSNGSRPRKISECG
jgi:hypothetical protein